MLSVYFAAHFFNSLLVLGTREVRQTPTKAMAQRRPCKGIVQTSSAFVFQPLQLVEKEWTKSLGAPTSPSASYMKSSGNRQRRRLQHLTSSYISAVT